MYVMVVLNQGVFIVLLKDDVITPSSLRRTIVVPSCLQNNAGIGRATRWRGYQRT